MHALGLLPSIWEQNFSASIFRGFFERIACNTSWSETFSAAFASRNRLDPARVASTRPAFRNRCMNLLTYWREMPSRSAISLAASTVLPFPRASWSAQRRPYSSDERAP